MKPRRLFLAAITWTAVSLSCVNDAPADDASVASTPTGDLVFLKNDSIQMLSEDLRISVNKVRVNYVFRNNSPADITMKIGFPLPVMVVGASRLEFRWRLPHDQNFAAWIDGKPITADMTIRIGRFESSPSDTDGSGAKWIDLTDEFNKLGLDPFNADNVPPEAMAKLHEFGLVDYLDETMKDEVASWNVKKTYTWTMTFPAKKDTSIRHEFKPWKGSFPEMTGEVDSYCPDQSFRDAAKKIGEKEHLEEANVDFILKTASNWFGPIKSFTLTIDKEGASLVSYCPIPGLKLVRSGNTFVGGAKDFEPKSDLSIYFLGRGISAATEAN